MERSKDFTDLILWHKAHRFALKVYEITADFPQEEIYGLTSQFRRAAASIAANIAEGFVKKGLADKLRFYNIAEGSLHECRYYLILGKDLGFIKDDVLSASITEAAKLLGTYSKRVRNSKDS